MKASKDMLPIVTWCKGWWMEYTADRPKGLGRRRLRREILVRVRALKGYHICWGIQRVVHIPRARCMLRKDVREP